MDGLTSRRFRATPDPAPLAMPVQSLRSAPPRRPRPRAAPRLMWLRRLLVLGGAALLAAAGLWQMEKVLAVAGLTPLALVMLALFLALSAWIALSFTSALAGFAAMLAGGDRIAGSAPPETRTALLMPCYNEDPVRIGAALEAMHGELCAARVAAFFDIFLLSDSNDPDIWIAEEAAFLRLRARTGAENIWYRRRRENTGRKSGNIADWVRRWGGAYEQFLILDADSIMQAATLIQLVAALEANPDLGLVQTLPIITGGSSLFARLQQFAGRVYGPLIAHGIAWWHGAEGNYWGHNAIIRTRAFAEQAGLPELPGRKPFGGHILSHDFVEAALIRRGGWAVRMLPALAGSYEASPPSLVDLALRDRRWCQGNLQHAAVLPARGLAAISRLHLLTGIGSYVTAPLWLLFLLAGILIAVQARFLPVRYFPAIGKSLFPQWPVIDPVRAMWMFAAMMAMLLLPKLLGTLAILSRPATRRGCGGAAGLLASLVLESLVSGLLAPVVMLTQTIDVVAVLAGRDSGWNPQRRDDGAVPLRELVRRYRWHTALGLGMGVAAWLVSPALALWMSPVVIGLALAIPLAAWTARPGWRALLRTPEERHPPAVLARARALLPDWADLTPIPAPDRLRADPGLRAAHAAMLPKPRRPGRDKLDVPLLVATALLAESACPRAAWDAMQRPERLAVLADAAALERLLA